MTRRFDAIVIGTGQAGPALAGRLTAAGMTVAIVERGLIGGTCVNTGCKPTKTLVASAYAAHLARRGADFGVVTGDIRIDMARVHARSQKISADSRASNETWLRGMERCTLLLGHAQFESAARGARGRRSCIEAERIFHQCRRPRADTRVARPVRRPLFDQQFAARDRRVARATRDRRRQLCRAGVRADLPSLWRAR